MTFDSLPSADFSISKTEVDNRSNEHSPSSSCIATVNLSAVRERAKKMIWPGQSGPGDMTVLATPPGRERVVLIADLAMTHARGEKLPDGRRARACKVVISTTPERGALFASLIDPVLLGACRAFRGGPS